MASKSQKLRRTFQCRASSEELEDHTKPIVLSDTSEGSCSPTTGSSGCIEEIQNPSRSMKRKSSVVHDGPRKLRKGILTPSKDRTSTCPSFIEDPSFIDIVFSSISKGRKRKRKSEKREETNKRSNAPSEGKNKKVKFSDESEASTRTPHSNSREAFLANFETVNVLGTGDLGTVYAGFRKKDNLPVAIKRISQRDSCRIPCLLDGVMTQVPLEVAIMLKVKPAGGTSAVVTLLDWYDLERELILITERPVPCCNLSTYINGSSLPEHEVQAIAKQLLDGLIEIHAKDVAHRDIKPENILIETGSDGPRVRIIDFGRGAIITEDILYPYQKKKGLFTSQMRYTIKRCNAEQFSLLQFGRVLCSLLDARIPFNRHSLDIIHYNPKLGKNLSTDGKSFLRSCLSKKQDNKPTLDSLREHPWMSSTVTHSRK